MEPRFEILGPKLFTGMRMRMTFADNKTYELWHGFMPRKKEISNVRGTDLYSLEVYPTGFFEPFDPLAEFDKWACVEVTESGSLPDGMEILAWEGGLYAVFLHKGPASTGPVTYGHIFGTWLPASGYWLDQRPHFAVMGPKYKGESEDSEEEVWIPVEKRDA